MPPCPPTRLDAGPVVLRRNEAADAEAIAAVVAANLDHLRPWMPWADEEAGTVERQRSRIDEVAEQWARGTDHGYVILDPDESTVLGACGLHRRVGEGGIEIGYWVHVDHVGRGIATAAARALTDAALALPDVQRVEIRCDEANPRSAAVPRRLGYRLDRVEEVEVTAPAETGRRMIWVLDPPS